MGLELCEGAFQVYRVISTSPFRSQNSVLRYTRVGSSLQILRSQAFDGHRSRQESLLRGSPKSDRWPPPQLSPCSSQVSSLLEEDFRETSTYNRQPEQQPPYLSHGIMEDSISEGALKMGHWSNLSLGSSLHQEETQALVSGVPSREDHREIQEQ
ncbi:hypothetical protein LEMLEM_LOCUS23007 [Lemmus lemmus]